MGLPLLEVKGFIEGMELRLSSTAQERSVKELLQCSTVHSEDHLPIQQTRVCSGCGQENPDTACLTKENVIWQRDEVEKPYFEVRGYTVFHDQSLVRDMYFAEVVAGDRATANLCKALGRRTGIVGYLRVTRHSDERVAVLQSPETGILTLSVLYYLDTEATQPVKAVREPSHWNPAATRLQERVLELKNKAVAELPRREYDKAVKHIEKEVWEKETTHSKGSAVDGKTRKASR